MAEKKKTSINLETLNAFADTICDSIKAKEDAHKQELMNAASEVKLMVDTFEKAGFSHEDAMDLVKCMVTGGINGGQSK